jgi:hypothetical protein
MRTLHNAETVAWIPVKAPSAQTGLPLDFLWLRRDFDEYHPESPMKWLWLSGFDGQPWAPDDCCDRSSNEIVIGRSD